MGANLPFISTFALGTQGDLLIVGFSDLFGDQQLENEGILEKSGRPGAPTDERI